MDRVTSQYGLTVPVSRAEPVEITPELPVGLSCCSSGARTGYRGLSTRFPQTILAWNVEGAGSAGGIQAGNEERGRSREEGEGICPQTTAARPGCTGRPSRGRTISCAVSVLGARPRPRFPCPSHLRSARCCRPASSSGGDGCPQARRPCADCGERSGEPLRR